MCSVVLSFFFFKQKTAYERRISDWSSDVCSSDLLAGMASRGRRRMADCFPSLDPLGSQDLHVTSNRWTTRLARNLPNAARSIWRRLVQEAKLGPGGKRGQDRAQIGRASCRGRVWQNV